MQEVRVGKVDEFQIGTCRVIQIGKEEIGVIRSDDGEFHAIRNYCPHRGGKICSGGYGGTFLPSHPGEVIYGLEGQLIKCPWHGYEFKIDTGDIVFCDLKLRLKIYPIITKSDDLFVVFDGKEQDQNIVVSNKAIELARPEAPANIRRGA